MDVLSSEIDTEPPWAMLFANDLVLCETSKAAVERELEIWRDQFERQELRVSRTNTAYMPCNDYDNNSRNYEEIQLGDDKLNTVTTKDDIAEMEGRAVRWMSAVADTIMMSM